MKEISLHILDIVQNSISAKATLVKIVVDENTKKNELVIKIIDNGIGMSKEVVEKVMNPFFTTRTTRNVGLGIPLFQAAAERCGGEFHIWSEIGKGTQIIAKFKYDHIDRAPIGKIHDTILTIIMSNAIIDCIYIHRCNEKKVVFDTRKVKRMLEGVPLTNEDVLLWIQKNI